VVGDPAALNGTATKPDRRSRRRDHNAIFETALVVDNTTLELRAGARQLAPQIEFDSTVGAVLTSTAPRRLSAA